MLLKFDTALHESLPQIVACWKNKKPIDKMMREGPELVADPGCSWLCVIVHVCTWLWLPLPASKDEVVDIIPAHVTEDDKLFQYFILLLRVVGSKFQQVVVFDRRLQMVTGSLADGHGPRNECLAVRSHPLLAACSAFRCTLPCQGFLLQ